MGVQAVTRELVVSAPDAEGPEVAWLRARGVDPDWVAGARGVRVVVPLAEPGDWVGEAQAAGVDAAMRPVGFSAGVVVFDGDGTLLDGETIDQLGELAGRGEAIAAVTARAMAGDLDFEAALRERVAQLRGLPVASLGGLTAGLPLHSGVDDALASLRRSGVALAVFSGGFHFFLDPLATRWGLDRVVANRLEVADGVLTGGLVGPIVDAAAKAIALRRLAADHGVDLDRCVAVGDGANDLPMLRAAGLAVGFQPKPVLLPSLDAVICRGDMRALLDFLA